MNFTTRMVEECTLEVGKEALYPEGKGFPVSIIH
jgi:RNA 3'-terminal phosphate cyclase